MSDRTARSCTTIGHFRIFNSRRESIKNPNTKKTYPFYFYNSQLTGKEHSRPALLREYSPPKSEPYPDWSLIHLHGRMYIPEQLEQAVEIEIISAYVFPGDPRKKKYDKGLPEIPPTICVAGHVIPRLRHHEKSPDRKKLLKRTSMIKEPDETDAVEIHDSRLKSIHIDTAEYVNNQARSFEVM